MNGRHALGAGFVLAMLTAAPSPGALGESRKGPFYAQGTVPLGVNYWYFPAGSSGAYSWSGWRPDLEFGLHFSGRHDGLVLGVRQAFLLTAIQGHAAATTALRGGWDIPIALASFELTVAPYATVGLGYLFDGPHAGINFSGGIEAKFFFAGGLYAFARPFEMGAQCFHDGLGGLNNCALGAVFGAGVGFAFPTRSPQP